MRGFTLIELMITVAIIGVLSALAIYGVSRYLSGASAAEAKQIVGAITRLAASTVEQEVNKAEMLTPGQTGSQSSSILCGQANPVPVSVPAGWKYQPKSGPQEDFRQGDEQTGWVCLHFEVTQPISYQYQYNSGGSYVSPGYGGPDPGANGFEAAALGDRDADGQYAVFSRSGSVDLTNGTVNLSTAIFVFAEFE